MQPNLLFVSFCFSFVLPCFKNSGSRYVILNGDIFCLCMGETFSCLWCHLTSSVPLFLFEFWATGVEVGYGLYSGYSIWIRCGIWVYCMILGISIVEESWNHRRNGVFMHTLLRRIRIHDLLDNAESMIYITRSKSPGDYSLWPCLKTWISLYPFLIQHFMPLGITSSE